MKSKPAICIFLLIFMIICSCNGKPKIQFDESSHNFGDVEQNTELIHIFTFKNTGDSTLVIKKVKPG